MTLLTHVTKWLEPAVVSDVARMLPALATGWLSASAIGRIQRRRLARLVRQAVAHSPHYRRLFAELERRRAAEGKLPLQAFPCLTKAELRKELVQVGTDAAIRGD